MATGEKRARGYESLGSERARERERGSEKISESSGRKRERDRESLLRRGERSSGERERVSGY
jgi:hypothetical protein